MRLAAVLLLSFLFSCGPDEGHDHGIAHELGEQSAGPFTVSVTLFGEVEPGAEVALDVQLTGSPVKAATVHGRLANEAGDGTVNAALPRGGGSSFHAHVAVPEGLPDDAAVWITVRDEKGNRHEARFDLPD